MKEMLMQKAVVRIVLAMLAVMVIGASVVQAESERTVYFVVVPGSVESGDLEPALFHFKRDLAELAGGYTELGQSFGSTFMGEGNFSSSGNISFLVASMDDIQAQIVEIANKHLGTTPFILSWPATCNF